MDEYNDPWEYVRQLLAQRNLTPADITRSADESAAMAAAEAPELPPADPWARIRLTMAPNVAPATRVPEPQYPKTEEELRKLNPQAPSWQFPKHYESMGGDVGLRGMAATPPAIQEPQQPPMPAPPPQPVQGPTPWSQRAQGLLAKFKSGTRGAAELLEGLGNTAPPDLSAAFGGPGGTGGGMGASGAIPEPPAARQFVPTPVPKETWLEGADRWGRNMASLPQVLRSGGVMNPRQMEADPSLAQRNMDWKAQNVAGAANVEEANRRDMAKWEAQNKMEYLRTSLEGQDRELTGEERAWLKSMGLDIPMGMRSRDASRWMTTILSQERLGQGQERLDLTRQEMGNRQERAKLNYFRTTFNSMQLEKPVMDRVYINASVLDQIEWFKENKADIDSVIGPILGRYNALKSRIGIGGPEASTALAELTDFVGKYLTAQTGAQRGMQEVAWLAQAMPGISQNPQQFWAILKRTEDRVRMTLKKSADLEQLRGKNVAPIRYILGEGMPVKQAVPPGYEEAYGGPPASSQEPIAPMSGEGAKIPIAIKEADGRIRPMSVTEEELQVLEQSKPAGTEIIRTQ